MVLELGPAQGSPMTENITALHIVGAAINGVVSMGALFILYGINRDKRDKNSGTISMVHGAEGAPLFGGFVGLSVIWMIYFLSYIFDGTAMTIFGHEPPTFVAAAGTLVYSYEFLYFAMWLSSLTIPLVVNGYRHGLTPGFLTGLSAVSTTVSLVGTFVRFQMKSDAFYGVSYTALILACVALWMIVLSYSNITTKSSYERAGMCALLSMAGLIGFIVLEMLFGFWFCFWVQSSSIWLEAALSWVICIGSTVCAMASEHSTLEQLLSRGKGVVSSIGSIGTQGSL